jgi:hypothetical protein
MQIKNCTLIIMRVSLGVMLSMLLVIFVHESFLFDIIPTREGIRFKCFVWLWGVVFGRIGHVFSLESFVRNDVHEAVKTGYHLVLLNLS